MQTFKKYLFLLSNRERKNGILLLMMIFIMACLDMLGVASILPFIAVLMNPSLIETNYFLITLFDFSSIFGIENNRQFLFFLGMLMFIFLLISLSFKAVTTYFQVTYVHMTQYTVAKRLVERYLHQPYSWFLNRHSADLGKTILSEVATIVGSGIQPFLDLISKSMIAIAILTLLAVVDLKVTIIVGLSLGIVYGFLTYISRKYLNKIGKKRLESNQLRFKIINELFSAIKEIKVSGLEQVYINLFSKSERNFERTQANSHIIARMPHFILEAITFGGVLLILLYLILKKGSFNNALPLISLYVLAGYRLVPALTGIYVTFTKIIFVSPSLNKLYDEIKVLEPYYEHQNNNFLSLNDKIVLNNITYNYPNSSRTALKNINLIIPAKSTVGFVGTTGSGKTTTVDIILGLFEAQKGTLEVDGMVISKKNSRAWQNSIGYVPQHIYLSDDTVAANIAFGVNAKDINQAAVEKASTIANLHEFVIDELPKKYETTIGERGVRLSGGQRQRIGIARALYHSPQVLLLDEATSALDNKTEEIVMEAVNKLGKKITIILIAHRLSTLKNCDIIFKLEKGQLVGTGTYNEIISKN